MYSKNNYQTFNTSIDDYSIEELYKLLELDDLSRENIVLKVDDLTTNVFNNNEPIKTFFLNAQTKLLNFLTNRKTDLTDLTDLDYYLHNNANANIEPQIRDYKKHHEDEEDEEDEEEEENVDEEGVWALLLF